MEEGIEALQTFLDLRVDLRLDLRLDFRLDFLNTDPSQEVDRNMK